MELSHKIEAGLHNNQSFGWINEVRTLILVQTVTYKSQHTFPTFFRLESAEKWVPGALYTFLY